MSISCRASSVRRSRIRSSRRNFLKKAGALAAGTLGATALSAVENDVGLSATETVSLRGQWWFRIDAGNAGTGQRWYGADESLDDWGKVDLPHTW